MNLSTLIEKNAFELLPLNLKEVTEARLEMPVKELSDIFLKGKCLDLITVSYSEQAQFNIEPQILAHQRDALLAELRGSNKFKELTWSEVQRAFKTGIRGESGPFFGMCAKTYHQFLKHYYEKPERIEGMRQYLALMETINKPEPSESEKKQKNFEACEWAFETYKNTGVIPNGHFKFYQTLMDLGLIKWTNEEKNEISRPIKKEYESEIETARKHRRISANQMAEILLNLDSNPTLISRIRKEALKRYFDKLITTNQKLKK